MNVISARKQAHFTRHIQVFYLESFSLGGPEADQIGDVLKYHVFNFKFAGTSYEFKVTGNDKKTYLPSIAYPALLHRTLADACWFEGEEQLVYPFEPDQLVCGDKS